MQDSATGAAASPQISPDREGRMFDVERRVEPAFEAGFIFGEDGEGGGCSSNSNCNSCGASEDAP